MFQGRYGISNSYHQKGSTATDWPVGSSRAIHLSFYKPIEAVFHQSKRGQEERLE